MRAFQLDECSNDRKVSVACNRVGKSEVRRWPEDLYGAKDHLWIPDMMTRDAPILTIDFTIAHEEQNRRAIPANNSGMIVVKPEHASPGFGSKRASGVIECFKAVFPAWHDTDWSNVYVEITEVAAYVCDFTDETFSAGRYIRFDEPSFADLINQAIAEAKAVGKGRQLGDANGK